MAPLKFEDNIKEKLEERIIKPTDNSWDKLSAHLDKAQNRTPKKSFNKIWWYSIAAIFIGVIIITSFFKNNNPISDQVDMQYVNRDHQDVKENTTDLVEEVIINQESVEEDETISVDSEVKSRLVESLSNNKKQKVELESNVVAEGLKFENLSKNKEREGNNSSLASSANNKKVESDSSNGMITMDSEIVDKKVTDVIEQIKDMQSNNIEVTEDEINKLLRNAQREIVTKNVIESNAINASALLQDVEEELDETFKERVYEALKTGFIKVKTSVAQRKN